jgi:hypothetical protein
MGITKNGVRGCLDVPVNFFNRCQLWSPNLTSALRSGSIWLSMPDTTTAIEVGKIAAALVGGGAVGAMITATVTAHRNRIQPVGKRVEVTPLFTPHASPESLLRPSITISDGTADYKFKNLFLTDIQVVNRGNRDLPTFSFGVTLAKADHAVHAEPYGLDRHHVATLVALVSPAHPSNSADFQLKPFNRGDSYTIKIFIVAGGDEPGEIHLSSPEAIRFTEIPSLAETIASIASSYAIKVGPLEVRVPR